jgi:hypothetical protein
MVSFEAGFIIDQYDRKFEFSKEFWWMSAISNFSKSYEAVYGIRREVHLCSCINQGILYINMTENRKFRTFGLSVRNRI